MLKKVLIANRGEIAVRVERTCIEMGILTVALYCADDMASLHVRLADESVLLPGAEGFIDQDLILQIARDKGADAIHPGYGFLAEKVEFIRACERAGIKFIGPPAKVAEQMICKIDALQKARQAGFPVVAHSSMAFGGGKCGREIEDESLIAEADRIGYPLVIKSTSGGRGKGERLVRQPARLKEALKEAQAEALAVYNDQTVYLEKAVIPARQVEVQVLADREGHIIHLGERQSLLNDGNQKVISESPASFLSQSQRERLCETAVDLARLFAFQNVGTVEFIVDENDNYYFTEMKPRLKVEHPLTEIVSGMDLVREQIRLAEGEQLSLSQDEVNLRGWGMMCRINAHDPRQHFLPSPGRVNKVRLPGGPGVRVDTYIYGGCTVPGNFDPLIGKVSTWADNRENCRQRMQRALEELRISGPATNLSLLQGLLNSTEFIQRTYTTQTEPTLEPDVNDGDEHLRDLAAVAGVLFSQYSRNARPEIPERLRSGWHRKSREL